MKKFSSDSKFLLLILGAFTFLSLLLFWPIFLGKVNLNGNLLVSFYAPFGQNLPFKNTGWDQLRIYFPFYKVTLDAIKHFSLPLWNPYAFSGHPHMADFQTGVFYPLNIFGIFLNQINFWHFLRITPTILASFFTFLYLRSLRSDVILETRRVDRISGGTLSLRSRVTGEGRGLSIIPAIFGAITFGFSPFILTWGEEVILSPHSIVWLPLILFAIEKYLNPVVATTTRGSETGNGFYHSLRSFQNDGKLYLFLISIATAFSFLGGYMQTSIYMFIFVFAYLVFRLYPLLRHPELVSGSGVKIPNLFGFAQGELVRNDIKKIFYLFGSFVLGAGIAAIQILPSAELFFNAARSTVSLKDTLFKSFLPPETILTYLSPDFFGHPATANFFRRGVAQYYEGILFAGIAALIFAAFAVFGNPLQKIPKFKKLIPFLAIFGLVSLSTTIDLPSSKLFLSLPIPFLSTSIANRILFLPAFCISILSAIGMEIWLTSKDRRILKVIAYFALIYFLILAILGLIKLLNIHYFEYSQFRTAVNLSVSFRNLIIPILVFLLTGFLVSFSSLWPRFKNQAAILLILLSFAHIFYFGGKYFSFTNRENVFPKNGIFDFIAKNQGNFRSWGVGQAFLENNFASQYSIFWPEGYDSLNNRSYGEFTYAMQGNNLSEFVFRADAGVGRGGAAEMLGSSARRELIDLLGIKYLIGEEKDSEVIEKSNFKKVFETDPSFAKASEGNKYAVFENQQVMPRAFLASNYEGPPQLKEPEESGGQMSRREREEETSKRERLRRSLIPQKLLSDGFDWRNVLILETPSPISAQFGEGNAQILSYKPSEVIVKTKSDQPKLLFLSDNYYPGWKAKVDGEETPILRADYTFRAVPLIAGEHTVKFYYDSDVFKVGAFITLASLGTLSFFLLNKKLKIRS